MNWQHTTKRALETSFWTAIVAFALHIHFFVLWKLTFLKQHPEFRLTNATDETIRAQEVWWLVHNHPTWFCWAIVLVPMTCCAVQHLGLRWQWRMAICLIVTSPVIWYGHTAMQVAKKYWSLPGKNYCTLQK